MRTHRLFLLLEQVEKQFGGSGNDSLVVRVREVAHVGRGTNDRVRFSWKLKIQYIIKIIKKTIIHNNRNSQFFDEYKHQQHKKSTASS